MKLEKRVELLEKEVALLKEVKELREQINAIPIVNIPYIQPYNPPYQPDWYGHGKKYWDRTTGDGPWQWPPIVTCSNKIEHEGNTTTATSIP